MIWILFLLITIFLWGTYNLFFKLVGPEINYFLAVMIIGLSQSAIALLCLLFSFPSDNVFYNFKWVLFSVIMGLLVGIGTITFFYTFKFGANASIAIPVYTIGALLIGVIGGICFYKEQISVRAIVGLLFGIVSVFLLTIGGK